MTSYLALTITMTVAFAFVGMLASPPSRRRVITPEAAGIGLVVGAAASLLHYGITLILA